MIKTMPLKDRVAYREYMREYMRAQRKKERILKLVPKEWKEQKKPKLRLFRRH